MEEASSPIKTLVIEDDDRLGTLIARYLESHGLIVTRLTTGTDGFSEALRRQYDVVLLDLMLPGKDGMDVCRELRTRLDVPIIIMTARADEVDRVLGLEAGADDYVVKPFSARELLARVRAVVRRARGQAGPAASLVRVGALCIDPARMTVHHHDQEISVTAYEFAILRALASRPGRVLSREQLLDLAKGSADEAFDRSIDVHVSRLRAKLGDSGRQPRLLKTVRGAGYMLAVIDTDTDIDTGVGADSERS